MRAKSSVTRSVFFVSSSSCTTWQNTSGTLPHRKTAPGGTHSVPASSVLAASRRTARNLAFQCAPVVLPALCTARLPDPLKTFDGTPGARTNRAATRTRRKAIAAIPRQGTAMSAARAEANNAKILMLFSFLCRFFSLSLLLWVCDPLRQQSAWPLDSMRSCLRRPGAVPPDPPPPPIRVL